MTNIHVFHPNLQPSARSVPAKCGIGPAGDFESRTGASRTEGLFIVVPFAEAMWQVLCRQGKWTTAEYAATNFMSGRTCEHGDAAAPPQVSSVRYSSVVRAFVGTNSRNACDTVGETLLDDALAGGETSVASVTKKATPTKPLPQHGKSQLQRHFGPGEAFGIETGGHPSVLKTYKTREGASRSMAKASSNNILGLGKPLRSGQGAIDRDRGGHPSVLKSHKTSQGASRSMAKASSNDILGVGKPLRSGQGAIRQFWNPIKPERQRHFGLGQAFGIGAGGHPSVLKLYKTSQGASRSMAKASSNDILGLGKPLRSGQGAIRQFWNLIKPERGRSVAKASSNDILGLGKPVSFETP